jgi:hypothetical protein
MDLVNIKLEDIETGQLIWDIIVNSEELKGIIRALYVLILTFDNMPDLSLTIDTNTQEPTTLYLKYNIKSIYNSELPVYSNITLDSARYYPAPKGKYAWWIVSTYPFYDMVAFTSNDYIKGFVRVFELFGIDFRDYVAGGPFATVNNRNLEFAIPGYDLISFQNKITRPNSIMLPYIDAALADSISDYQEFG